METHSELVKKVITLCESVPTYLNTTLCYSEFCYQQLIKQLLQQSNIYCETEAPVYFKTKCGINFGWGKIDILVRSKDEVIIIELKANVKGIVKAEKQLQRYMEHFESDKPITGIAFLYNSMDRHPIRRVLLKQ